MHEIKCPQCGTVFPIDENSYAEIKEQVRNDAFNEELERRSAEAVELVELKLNREIDALRAALRQKDTDQAMAVRDALDKAKREAAAKENLITALNTQLQNKDQLFEIQKKQAVLEAVKEQEARQHEKDKRIIELEGQIKNVKNNYELKEAERTRIWEQRLNDKDDEIDRLKYLKTRLNNKMVGETLEQHCEIEFNRIRTSAYPHAYFEKDNDARSGSKGDYVFRDYDELGTEYISIMFEMKNEMEETVAKHKNQDFLKKLDKDRTEKKCEYAVLVSMLEADSELYNQGIVECYQYPKMYVIRPQFFLPLISLLSNAAQNSIDIRRQLVDAKKQNYAAEQFNRNLMDFKELFSKHYQNAANRFNDAIDEIDKSIRALQKVKDALLNSETHLRHANDRANDLTIKSLTKGNPEMQQLFTDAGVEIK
ncbi:MAG: DUF2130 domain-containing protein [Oscillospiraceae bacterium]|nr:DUF2130 domain-containing protein [Oscillospiraceae bacterium]